MAQFFAITVAQKFTATWLTFSLTFTDIPRNVGYVMPAILPIDLGQVRKIKSHEALKLHGF